MSGLFVHGPIKIGFIPLLLFEMSITNGYVPFYFLFELRILRGVNSFLLYRYTFLRRYSMLLLNIFNSNNAENYDYS